MGFESPRIEKEESITARRATLTMDLVRTDNLTVPQAVRQVLINERITDKNDVKRITSEVGTYLANKSKKADEAAAWDEMESEILARDAAAAETRDRQKLGDEY